MYIGTIDIYSFPFIKCNLIVSPQVYIVLLTIIWNAGGGGGKSNLVCGKKNSQYGSLNICVCMLFPIYADIFHANDKLN